MTQPFISIVETAVEPAPLSDWAHPIVDDHGDVALTPHEQALMPPSFLEVTCATAAHRTLWELATPAKVTFTTERIAFSCERYNAGKRHMAIGLPMIAVAFAGQAVSAHRAKKRRQGKVALGHLRYEWVTKVAVERGLTRRPTGVNIHAVAAGPEPTPVVLQLGCAHQSQTMGHWLARVIASYQEERITSCVGADRPDAQAAAERRAVIERSGDADEWSLVGAREGTHYVYRPTPPEKLQQLAGAPKGYGTMRTAALASRIETAP